MFLIYEKKSEYKNSIENNHEKNSNTSNIFFFIGVKKSRIKKMPWILLRTTPIDFNTTSLAFRLVIFYIQKLKFCESVSFYAKKFELWKKFKFEHWELTPKYMQGIWPF